MGRQVCLRNCGDGELGTTLANTIRMGRREIDNEDGMWMQVAQVHIQ
jgi:hypothetical protein